MSGQMLEPKLFNQAPSVCTKPGCGCKLFIPHEDGWQCFNCMKVMYKASNSEPNSSFIKRINRRWN